MTKARAAAPAAPAPTPILAVARPRVQARLTVGAPDDVYEREADRVAAQVMAAPAPGGGPPAVSAISTPRAQPVCETCKDKGGTCGCAQRRTEPAAPAPLPATAATLDAPAALRGRGQPLSRETRAFFEPRFGHDFRSVRVHTDGESALLARELGAQAFTIGRDIVFSEGRYQPSSAGGRNLLAHELTHVIQQSSGRGAPQVQTRGGRGPGSCGWIDAAAATVLGGAAHVQIEARLASRGLAVELPIPRANKLYMSPRCQPTTTSGGFADVARITTPTKGISEIKPFYLARTLGVLEATHYRRRAIQSQQRLTSTGACGVRRPGADDVGFSLAIGGISRATRFSLLRGAITGTEDFGPFSLDRGLNLKAKEVASGAIGYWCVLNSSSRRRRRRRGGSRTRTRPPTRTGPPTRPRTSTRPRPRGGGSAGLGIGFGIAIMGANVGVANAGVGVSVGSNSAAAGTAGAGASWFSDSAAAGSAGAGVSVNSESAAAAAVGAGVARDGTAVAAGVAGAGASSGSSTAAAGAAGAGTSTDTEAAAAGVAGTGNIRDSSVAVAGSAGSGDVEGASGTSTGSPRREVSPSDVTGPNADRAPPASESGEAQTEGAGGEAAEGPSADPGEGSGAGAGTGTAAAGTGTGTGTSGTGTAAVPGVGTSTGAAAEGETTGGTAGDVTAGAESATTGTSTAPSIGVLPVFPFGASDADRDRIAAEAARVTALLEHSQEAQRELLRYLASQSPTGQYLVPTSEWVRRLLRATDGLTAEEMAYLRTLDWRPGSISEAELRARIRQALANRSASASADGPTGTTRTTTAPPRDGRGPGAGGTERGTARGTGTDGARTEGAGTSRGTAAESDGTTSLAADRATAPPPGTSRTQAGLFRFLILSGLTQFGSYREGQVVTCTVRINDGPRTFELTGVDITYLSRTEVEAAGFVTTTFRIHFTRDFWSPVYSFYGIGGPEVAAEYDFGRRRRPR